MKLLIKDRFFHNADVLRRFALSFEYQDSSKILTDVGWRGHRTEEFDLLDNKKLNENEKDANKDLIIYSLIKKKQFLLPTLEIIANVSPLLGLLGTVIGMIETFQAITLFGTGDPKLMAGGISQALVTTVLGLLVAIPTTLLHSFTASSAKGIISVLEEQSTGILAERAEGS